MLTNEEIQEKALMIEESKEYEHGYLKGSDLKKIWEDASKWARDKCNEWISVDIKPNDKQRVRVTDGEDVNEGCYYANYYGGFPRLIKGPNSEEIYADAKYWQPVSEPPKK